VALILTGIRASTVKRRRHNEGEQEEHQAGVSPPIPCMIMKTNGR
jgi:hypothetical protein